MPFMKDGKTPRPHGAESASDMMNGYRGYKNEFIGNEFADQRSTRKGEKRAE